MSSMLFIYILVLPVWRTPACWIHFPPVLTLCSGRALFVFFLPRILVLYFMVTQLSMLLGGYLSHATVIMVMGC